MDHKNTENPSTMSETYEQRVARLEANYDSSEWITINRASLINHLIHATQMYEKTFKSDNKADALLWDGVIRTLQLVIDMEVQSK